VIPTDNLVAIGLGTGPNGIKFDFSYNSRDNTNIVNALYFFFVALISFEFFILKNLLQSSMNLENSWSSYQQLCLVNT
jgi:hypothetical protein